ncbi:DNA translocase FtsK [Collibacillus ludicampi]|uniref:DNA translocase FtsK n=1 Tax=Collibacillus ludicampi TaxID=2771369 RepID=A0AAV4LJQ8_9BACL|nr:DNA translocase FtsK [Collibacillus ludicampi]GIM47863.1 DNA translocase FtsK [Collibacillus ludicampi]
MGKKIEQTKSFIKYEIIGLILLAIAGVSLARVGWLGEYVNYLFLFAAGNWYWLLGVYLCYLAFFVMVKRTRPQITRRMAGILLFLLVLLTWDHLNLYTVLLHSHGNVEPDMLDETVTRIYALHDYLEGKHQPISAGGGLIGLLFFLIAHKLFDTLGLLIVLIISGIISLILITGKSLVAFVGKIKSKIDKRSEKLGQRVKSIVEESKNQRHLKKEAVERARTEQAIEMGEEEQAESPRKTNRFRFFTKKKGKTQEDHERNPESGEKREEIPLVFRDFTENILLEDKSANGGSALDGQQELGPTFETLSQHAKIRVRFPHAEQLSEENPASSNDPVQWVMNVPDEHYQIPHVSLLDLPKKMRGGKDRQDVMENAKKLEETLDSFGVQVKVTEVHRGPTVTRYEVTPAVGVKVSRIVSLTDDLALALAARDIRIEAPIPGKSAVGIEVPNKEVAVVSLREVLESDEFQKSESRLTIALGRDISGAPIVGNLAKMPHVLVAGATGSGKSVCINGMITSILYKAKPHEVKFIMVDPKMVELNVYNGIPHLMAPVVTDPRRAAYALKKVVAEMEHRYELFAKEGARNMEGYNAMMAERGQPQLPFIVVIVDELADLMMVAPGDVEDAICRLAQMARAAGIHLIIATQRPSVDVITGVIKANIPSRIAFAVSSQVDSRTILDSGGAEKLLGRGDMLYLPIGESKPIRVQGAFLSDAEVERVVSFVKNQQQEPSYTLDLSVPQEENAAKDEDIDPLFYEALKLVVESEQASVSMIQRRLKVGYARAARLIDQMEERGYVGPFEGSRPREVLLTKEQWNAMNMNVM